MAQTTSDRKNLITCYLTGQIEEWAWQEHLVADPKLRTVFGMARIASQEAQGNVLAGFGYVAAPGSN